MNSVAQRFSRVLRQRGSAEELFQKANMLSRDGEDVVSKRCIQYALSGEKLMSIDKVGDLAKATNDGKLISEWLKIKLGIKNAEIDLNKAKKNRLCWRTDDQ